MRLLILLAALAGPAMAAPCTTHDAWTGPDKVKHFGVGVTVGAAVTLATESPGKGVLAAMAAGALKEAADRASKTHICSLQDFAMTAAGGVAGAYGTAWLVLPRKNGVQVAYVKAF